MRALMETSSSCWVDMSAACRDWVKTIEDSFQAIQVTPSMWIVPNEADISDQDAINILMKPGAAFGTGRP